MNTLDNINQRSSVPAKFHCEPGPDPQQLETILQTAMSAPDHGGLQPFRFVVIQHEARKQLATIFEQAIRQRDPQAGEEYFQKQYKKPLRSPVIVTVVCKIDSSGKIPVIEQQLSAGSAAQNILIASYAMGFGACWLTGDNAYDPMVKEALGLAFEEEITGFIYIGSVDSEIPITQRQSASAITEYWKKPQEIDTAI